MAQALVSAAAIAAPGRPTAVLVVDDSAVVRQIVTDILSAARGLRVTAAVADPIFAMERMRMEWPDVVLLDIEMPRMDGLTFLRQIMAQRPTPVVICSSLTTKGAETTLRALSAGAVAVVAKPRVGAREHLLGAAAELVDAVRCAAQANVRAIQGSCMPTVLPRRGAATPGAASRYVVGIGASTGGTVALEAVLSRLPELSPGVVVVQHMPENFTAAFAARLASLCRIEVREARDGDMVRDGLALIAPGGRQMTVCPRDAGCAVAVRRGPPVNRHCPSVDVLFRSLADTAGPRALGILMTGMGDDGARGMLEMRRSGARTLAQDERSCVVFGMPKEAVRMGAACATADLDGIAAEIIQAARRL